MKKNRCNRYEDGGYEEELHPPYRLLRGFTIDPSFSTRLDSFSVNTTAYEVPWEKLLPGPLGEYVNVVDIDPMSKAVYKPVDLELHNVLAQNGLTPSTSNPQFHQQFVYLITSLTIQNFEKALGRKVIWKERLERIDTQMKSDEDIKKYNAHYIPRLNIHPHAFEGPNAYYDSSKNAILYGYFKAVDEQNGTVLPGGVVFTCLSPDIIAHETTHAILDSIHPRFIENTSPDAAAFHEGFADIVALLQRFAIKDLVISQLKATKGVFSGSNVFGTLATEFGESTGNGHNALRSAIGFYNEEGNWELQEPDKTLIHTTNQAHDRGAILVAIIFRAFTRLYERQTEDLFRIANIVDADSSILPLELYDRLAEESISIANQLLHVCIQALDFLPPVDISFGDYLRAIITADYEMAPHDPKGFRVAIIEAFSSWGVYPNDIHNLSEEALLWNTSWNVLKSSNHLCIIDRVIDLLQDQVLRLIGLEEREEIYKTMNTIKFLIHKHIIKHKGEYEEKDENGDLVKRKIFLTDKDFTAFKNKLGLLCKPQTYTYEDDVMEWQSAVPKIQVHSIRGVDRVSREGVKKRQLVITIIQTLRAAEGSEYEGLVYRGGCTLVVDLTDDKSSEYIIYKDLKGIDRLHRQLDHQLNRNNNTQLSTYTSGEFGSINFRELHAH